MAKITVRGGLFGALVTIGVGIVGYAGFSATRSSAKTETAPATSTVVPARGPVVADANVAPIATPTQGWVADMSQTRKDPRNKRIHGMLPPGADGPFHIGGVAQGRPMKLWNGQTVIAPPHSFALTVNNRHAAAPVGGRQGLDYEESLPTHGGWHVRHMRVITRSGREDVVTVFVQTSIAKGLLTRDDGKQIVSGGAMISVKEQKRIGLYDATYDIPDCAPGGKPSGRYIGFRDPNDVPPVRQPRRGPAGPVHQYKFDPTNVCPPTECPVRQQGGGVILRRKAELKGSVSHLTIG